MQVIDSLTAPLKDKNWPVKVLIGGVMSFLTILFGLGSILTGGYALRTIRDAAEGVDKLPEWDNWGDLLWQGLMLFVVALVAFIIPGGMIAFGFGSLLVGLISAGNNEAFSHLLAGAGVGMAVGGAGVLLMFVIGFFFPMMMLRVAIHRGLGAAFDIGAVLRDIMKIGTEYVLMYIILWVVSGAAGSALAFLSFIPILPQILGAAIGFYLTLVCAHTLGTLYRKRLAQQD